MTEVTQTEATLDKPTLRSNLHYLAWGQALVATIGSLFFSEVLGFLPCILCWYQRILMYPHVLIIGTGILLRDQRLRYYVLPMSILGWFIGLYHNLLYYGAIPEEFHICTTGIPCETRWIEWLGFVGIPLLSFTAFTVITIALLWHKSNADQEFEDAPSSSEKPSRFLKLVSGGMVLVYILVIAVGIFSRVTPTAETTNSFAPPSSDLATLDPLETASPENFGVYSSEMITQGQQLYSRQCAGCHGQDARGLPNLGLSLIGSQFVNERTDAELVEFIIVGRLPSDPENRTGIIMPSKGGNPALTEEDILAVVAYIRSLNS